MNQGHLHQLSLDAVEQGCRDESARFRAGQPGETGYCFELFRRAVEENDQDAWSAIHTQYYYQVAKWIGAHPEMAELIESTYTKFWHTMRNKPLSRHFQHIGAVLAYLRKCALCVRIDLERQQRRQDRILQIEKSAQHDSDIEAQVIARMDHNEFCDGVHQWLDENVCDQRERQIIFFSYDLGLSPSEIARRYPEHFASAKQVYGIKERMIKRMRRSDELKQLVRH
ncbi:MAG: sigma-70 family RNA polymerase sigma factor [Anaerolineae bacterium]|nr:sigma-70 family RNA polymerase sigma factor [Anaerolineae bacterium]